jgi:hypothetical protein
MFPSQIYVKTTRKAREYFFLKNRQYLSSEAEDSCYVSVLYYAIGA